jgi:hypothetical protein
MVSLQQKSSFTGLGYHCRDRKSSRYDRYADPREGDKVGLAERDRLRRNAVYAGDTFGALSRQKGVDYVFGAGQEIKRLLAALLLTPSPPGHAAHWLDWRRRHQARSRWYHQRTRLARDAEIPPVR